ncbi:hypothetical protein JNUCC31_21515 [Paenibacillus sp. JNUCC31]|uniref:hypothetical protein n=1 Tax=Paenibacillus sp. JNUCC-31 TaxID=2777983 RepID=UPI001781A32C|nr:hypothetical protein [Paenibacillus sp. JNUCC-31]QOS77358.1 hypothetical protein JNUCC31_21515 [Paenibacillus sp. JNUCC-31]
MSNRSGLNTLAHTDRLSSAIRQTLKMKLEALVPAWNGRVQDISAPGEVLTGPCAVIAFAEEVPKSAWAGYRRVIKISPYARPEDGGAEQVEAWSAVLMEGLHQVRLEDEEGGAFTCIYLGSSDCDRVDASSGLVTRSLRFGVYVPETMERAQAETADSWMAALQSWTQAQLGQEWFVYGDVWPGGYRAQSILWRLMGCNITAAGTSALEVRKQWIGHVVAANVGDVRQTVTHLVEQLAVQTRIALTDRDDTRYVTVDEVSADLQADAYLNGQIRLTLQQRNRRPSTDAPLIREIHHSKGIE